MQARFRETFCRRHVREGVLVGFFRALAATCRAFCDSSHGQADKTPPNVLLLLSRACRDLETSTVHYLVCAETLQWKDKYSMLSDISAVGNTVL